MARWAALAALAVGAFEACSTSGDSTSLTPSGPPTLQITLPLDSVDCDSQLVVHLTTSWELKPPSYACTTSGCGSVLVTLLETADGPPLVSQRAATKDVQLDLTNLVSPKAADAPTLSQVHFIKAQLLDGSLNPVVATGAGENSSQQEAISLAPNGNCDAEGGASAAGAPGAGAAPGDAGAAGAFVGEGGQGGAPAAGGTDESGAGGEIPSSI